jgi:hypothetical protein
MFTIRQFVGNEKGEQQKEKLQKDRYRKDHREKKGKIV